MIAKILSLLAKYIWIKKLGILNGLALIISIYAHEYGHYFKAKELNYKPQTPRFVPFLGAYVKHEPLNSKKHLFEIAFAGPLFGGIVGIVSFYLSLIFNSDFLHQIALFSLIINLSNLAPISILDGGRIAQSLSYTILQNILNVVIIIIGFVFKKYFFVILGAIGILLFFIIKHNDEYELKEMKKETKIKNRNIYLLWIAVLLIHTLLILKKT